MQKHAKQIVTWAGVILSTAGIVMLVLTCCPSVWDKIHSNHHSKPKNNRGKAKSHKKL
jgi:hypothetical protein